MNDFLIEYFFKKIMTNEENFEHKDEYRNYFSEFNQIIRHAGLKVTIEIFKKADESNKRNVALNQISLLLLGNNKYDLLNELDIMRIESAVNALKIYNETFKRGENNE